MNRYSFQTALLRLQAYWSRLGYTILQPIDSYVGAGTSHPATFFSALSQEDRRFGYVQPSRRPTDGRYGESPMRLQHYYQFQLIMKPPSEGWRLEYLESLKEAFGLDPQAVDLRFFEDNWENPSLGAAGLGWEVWIDGLEVTQLTYFQQMGGLPCPKPLLEVTYGLERLVMLAQKQSSLMDLVWCEGPSGAPVTYGDLFLHAEQEGSRFNFEVADVPKLLAGYESAKEEAWALLQATPPLYHSAYQLGLRMSSLFNQLEARRAMGTVERKRALLELRALNQAVAQAYLKDKALKQGTINGDEE